MDPPRLIGGVVGLPDGENGLFVGMRVCIEEISETFAVVVESDSFTRGL